MQNGARLKRWRYLEIIEDAKSNYYYPFLLLLTIHYYYYYSTLCIIIHVTFYISVTTIFNVLQQCVVYCSVTRGR